MTVAEIAVIANASLCIFFDVSQVTNKWLGEVQEMSGVTPTFLFRMTVFISGKSFGDLNLIAFNGGQLVVNIS